MNTNTNGNKWRALTATIISAIILISISCDKQEDEVIPPPEEDKLSLDSLIATDQDVNIWDEVIVTAYTSGENVKYLWTTDHGSMLSGDSNSVLYWGCPSCEGLNTIRCEVTNEHGTVSDTIQIRVHLGI